MTNNWNLTKGALTLKSVYPLNVLLCKSILMYHGCQVLNRAYGTALEKCVLTHPPPQKKTHTSKSIKQDSRWAFPQSVHTEGDIDTCAERNFTEIITQLYIWGEKKIVSALCLQTPCQFQAFSPYGLNVRFHHMRVPSDNSQCKAVLLKKITPWSALSMPKGNKRFGLREMCIFMCSDNTFWIPLFEGGGQGW